MSKFTVKKSEIQNALKRVVPVTKSKTTIPITYSVLIEAKDNTLKFTGTNLNVRIETQCSAEVEKEGVFTFHATKLEQAVNKSQSDVIHIEVIEGKNHFKAGKFKFESSNLPVADFPENIFTECSKSLKVNAQTFINAVDSVLYAINKDDSRKILHGVKFESKGNVLTLVGTDAKKLSVSKCDVESDSEIEITCHKDNLIFIKYFNGDMFISTNDSQVCFSDGITSVYTKLIEGVYPNYNQFLSLSYGDKIKINSNCMVNCIDNILVAYTGNSTFANFKIENNSLSISYGDGNEYAKDEFSVDYDKEFEFCGNPQFVKDIFTNCNDEFLEMSIKDSLSPIRLDGLNYISVFMPMRDKGK